jgi:hypothetical protein
MSLSKNTRPYDHGKSVSSLDSRPYRSKGCADYTIFGAVRSIRSLSHLVAADVLAPTAA